MLAVALGFGVSLAFAAEPVHPYVGVNLQLAKPIGDFGASDLMQRQGGAELGVGIEADVGVAGDIADFYAGLRSGRHSAESSSTVNFFGLGEVRAEGTWTITEWLVGTRLHMRRSLRHAVIPFVGVALTGGRVTADANGTAFDSIFSAKSVSDPVTSLLLEGGILFSFYRFADLVGSLQYQDFNAHFEDPLWNGNVQISYVNIHLGVIYRIF